MSLTQEYIELIQQTKEWLLQSHAEKWVNSTPETVTYFKQYASNKKLQQQSPQPATIKKAEIPPPSQTFTSSPPSQAKPSIPLTPAMQEKPPVKALVQELKPTPPAPKTAVKIAATHDFKREPVEKIDPIPLDEVRKKMEELFPKWNLVTAIPSDDDAKKYSEQWKLVSEVYFVVEKGKPQDTQFIEKIADAIRSKYCPAKVIEIGSTIPECALLILTTPINLPEGYKTPTILMEGVNIYLSQPEKKKSLWKNICDNLAHLKP